MRDDVSKNISVYSFIERNKNLNVKYQIDGHLYNDKKDIPVDIKEREVYDWCVQQWEGIIDIKTYAGLFESKLKEFNLSFDQFSILYGIWECDLSVNEKFNITKRKTNKIMEDMVKTDKEDNKE